MAIALRVKSLSHYIYWLVESTTFNFAGMSERQAEIVLPQILPFAEPADGRDRCGRRKPRVKAGPAKQRIAMGFHITMELEIERMVLNQQECWPPMLQVETCEHCKLMPFDINRHEVDRE